jgi:hypothetical protein
VTKAARVSRFKPVRNLTIPRIVIDSLQFSGKSENIRVDLQSLFRQRPVTRLSFAGRLRQTISNYRRLSF